MDEHHGKCVRLESTEETPEIHHTSTSAQSNTHQRPDAPGVVNNLPVD